MNNLNGAIEMTQDIHEDGSVELCQRWRPGGAQGNTEQVFINGDSYVFAIRLASESWEFHTVSANCDPEIGCTFDDENGDPWNEWYWSDVEWFVSCNEFDLPYISDLNQ